MEKWKKKYLGNADFYRMVLLVAVPIMIQNAITNFVSLLDNIMVGQIGTEQMSGVAIVNQLMFVFNICVFGAVSAAGIFGAQFYGKGDNNGVKEAFRFKILACVILGVLWMMLFIFGGEALIKMFLHEGSDVGDIALTLRYARAYMLAVMPSMLPFALIQAYAQTLRETGETILPMKAGLISVAVNLILDYVFIFGFMGIEGMGVLGAAIATVVARIIECIIVVVWTHWKKEKNTYVIGLYKNFKISWGLTRDIIKTGTPLLLNETMWAAGMAILSQCYSTKGLIVVASYNISSTVSNLFHVVFIAMGSAISIIVGRLLGANQLEEAVETDRKMIVFSVLACLGFGAILLILAPVFPQIYKTSDEVRQLATNFLRISAIYMPINGFINASYFTLRSGGKTMITFLFDSVYIWVVNIPLAFLLTRFTGMPILTIYACCLFIDIIKCVIGYILVKKRVWVQHMV